MKATLHRTVRKDDGGVLYHEVDVTTPRGTIYRAQVSQLRTGPFCVGLTRYGRLTRGGRYSARSGRSAMAPSVSKAAEAFVAELITRAA